MIELVKVEFKPSSNRIAALQVRYYKALLMVDLCIYKEERLWVRMPEMWLGEQKIKFIHWEDKADSDAFQETVLNQLFDMVGFNLDSALKMKAEYFKKIFADKNIEKD